MGAVWLLCRRTACGSAGPKDGRVVGVEPRPTSWVPSIVDQAQRLHHPRTGDHAPWGWREFCLRRRQGHSRRLPGFTLRRRWFCTGQDRFSRFRYRHARPPEQAAGPCDSRTRRMIRFIPATATAKTRRAKGGGPDQARSRPARQLGGHFEGTSVRYSCMRSAKPLRPWHTHRRFSARGPRGMPPGRPAGRIKKGEDGFGHAPPHPGSSIQSFQRSGAGRISTPPRTFGSDLPYGGEGPQVRFPSLSRMAFVRFLYPLRTTAGEDRSSGLGMVGESKFFLRMPASDQGRARTSVSASNSSRNPSRLFSQDLTWAVALHEAVRASSRLTPAGWSQQPPRLGMDQAAETCWFSFHRARIRRTAFPRPPVEAADSRENRASTVDPGPIMRIGPEGVRDVRARCQKCHVGHGRAIRIGRAPMRARGPGDVFRPATGLRLCGQLAENPSGRAKKNSSNLQQPRFALQMGGSRSKAGSRRRRNNAEPGKNMAIGASRGTTWRSRPARGLGGSFAANCYLFHARVDIGERCRTGGPRWRRCDFFAGHFRGAAAAVRIRALGRRGRALTPKSIVGSAWIAVAAAEW